MKTKLISLIVCSSLFTAFTAVAKGTNPGSELITGSDWRKTITYTVESSSQLEGSPFTKVSLYVPDSSTKTDEVWAVYTTSDYYHVYSDAKTEEKVLKIPVSRYFKLIDLATKQSGSWEDVTYENLGYCYMPKKRILFDGKAQTIVSVCGAKTSLNKVSSGMSALSHELLKIMRKVKDEGEELL